MRFPRPDFRRLARSHRWTAIAAVAGASVAAAYAHFVGCRTGTCPITASVWTASLYGAIIGGTAAWPSRRDAAPPKS